MLQTTLPTGIEILDEQLCGGIRPGSIVALTAAPTSESERLLSHLLRDRPTHYLTTQRSRETVLAALEGSGIDVGTCQVHAVDPDAPLEDATRLVEAVSGASILVIDTMNPLEAADDQGLWRFLNTLKSRLVATGSFALLHCVSGRRIPAGRDTTECMADVVFDLETETYGDTIQNRLFVPKVRGGESLKQAIKLDLTKGVTVDTSRDLS